MSTIDTTIVIHHGYRDGTYRIDGVPDGDYADDAHRWPQRDGATAQQIAERRARELRDAGYKVDVREIA